MSGEERLNAERIQAVCGENFRLHLLDEVGSTNSALRQLAAQGAPEGTVVLAERQTAGRGRLGRSFFSPGQTGLYVSVLLRPEICPEDALFLTPAAAVAAAQAIEAVSGRTAAIKWVNDIYLDGRKVCGILTEASFGAQQEGLDYAVVGIGVNVLSPAGGFPAELAARAGAVFAENEAPKDVRSLLAGELLRRLAQAYGTLKARAFLPEYRRRSMLFGRRIDVIGENGTRRAEAVGMDDRCRLEVRYDDGTHGLLSTGEVQIRPADD